MVLNQGNRDSSYPIRYVGQEAILALLLDYDGTLSPIAPHPDLATIPPETKKVSKEQDIYVEKTSSARFFKEGGQNYIYNLGH